MTRQTDSKTGSPAAIQWPSGTKLFLFPDGFRVEGANGSSEEMRGLVKLGRSSVAGFDIIKYSQGFTITVSDRGITVFDGRTSMFYGAEKTNTAEPATSGTPPPAKCS